MRRLSKIIEHVALIWSKRHLSIKQRTSLFFAYLRIVVKRFLRGRISFGINYKHEKFLGYDVELDQFRDDFYWIFTEIFIEENYYFKTDNNYPLIFDIGGNIGMSVLYFKAIYPKSKVVVFEPSPDNVEILKRNIAKNKLENIEVHEVAVGKKAGEISVFKQGPGTTMYKEFAFKQKKAKTDQFGIEVKIPVHLLSDYITDAVDFLKLDVEGAEGEILENLNDSQKLKHVKQLAMEYHQFSFETNTVSQVSKILENNRFVFFAASDAHNITEATKGTYKTFMIFANKDEK